MTKRKHIPATRRELRQQEKERNVPRAATLTRHSSLLSVLSPRPSPAVICVGRLPRLLSGHPGWLYGTDRSGGVGFFLYYPLLGRRVGVVADHPRNFQGPPKIFAHPRPARALTDWKTEEDNSYRVSHALNAMRAN